TEERARRADVETARVCAVLAHVRLHEPAEVHAVGAGTLLDERDVAPRGRVQLARVVERFAGPREPVGREHVPLLARDLARLAADADRRVREEAEPLAHSGPRIGWGGAVARPN